MIKEMPKRVTIGAWTLDYTDGHAYGEISHIEFGPVEVIGYEGRPVSPAELAEDLEDFVKNHAGEYLTSLTQTY